MTIEVTEEFVRGALELAFKKVVEYRRERYKDASDLVRNAIEVRYDMMRDFIDWVIDCWCFSIDPFDYVDEWFWSEEHSYEDIWEYIYTWFDEDEQKEYSEEYTWDAEQEKLIEEWCDNNDYWYDSSYEIAVQNCFNYWY